ncbi:PIN domain-containing protein [Microbacterium bovistercoris]|uniref:PIN domain-containing protein n=1 Tax=Microbacterium bovistercoris TaxID=2293570 RepID=A0A371NP53_9MICO|nr:type II toxin-antitoxin system VapC family toxin [Microbacterium bovistercoris]REJ03964.1 PIN domain-containing protein [Microbacterium bovistercoris]
MNANELELIGIDTNVILRAVLRDDPRQSAAADEFFRGLGPNRRGFITQLTLAEVYWVLSRTASLSREESLEVIRRLMRTEVLEFDDGESVVEALQLAAEGADFADALINATMRMFGTTDTFTFDRGASRRLGWRLLDA